MPDVKILVTRPWEERHLEQIRNVSSNIAVIHHNRKRASIEPKLAQGLVRG